MQIIIMQNTFCLIYITNSKPYLDRRQNHLEILNEFMIGVMVILYIDFTDYCPNKWITYQAGWAEIIGFLICLIINIAIHLRETFHQIKLRIIRLYNHKISKINAFITLIKQKLSPNSTQSDISQRSFSLSERVSSRFQPKEIPNILEVSEGKEESLRSSKEWVTISEHSMTEVQAPNVDEVKAWDPKEKWSKILNEI